MGIFIAPATSVLLGSSPHMVAPRDWAARRVVPVLNVVPARPAVIPVGITLYSV